MRRFGVVLWFDNPSGEGMIYDIGGNCSLYIHYSAINPGEAVNDWRNIAKNTVVEITLYRNLYMRQVDTCNTVKDENIITMCMDALLRRGLDLAVADLCVAR